MIKNLLYTAFLSSAIAINCFAQQDPQYSQYMFNQLVINPAYAGSKEALSAVADLRQQWIAMPGAPQTGTISMHGPLPFKSLGVGGHMVYEKIGPATWTAAYADLGYRIKIGKGKLSLGLSAGAVNYNFRTTEMQYKNSGEVFLNNYPGAKTTYDVGSGLYYYNRSFFFGASATHLSASTLYSASSTYTTTAGVSSTSKVFFNLQPHLFIYTGKAFEVNENFVVNPSIMVKTILSNASSPSIDVNCNFLLKKVLWVGASYRIGYGVAALMQYYVSPSFKIGYCYDMGLNKIGTQGQSTHEIVLSYDFRVFKTKTLSPRYLFM
jgi:type IX secretion system PorP/SprF family membrane protein